MTETEEQRVARLVEAQMAKLRPQAPAPVQETADQRLERLVAEGVERRLAEEKQALTAAGQGPARKGLVNVRETSGAKNAEYAEIPEGWPQKPLQDYTSQEWKQYVEPHVAQSVFGSRGAPQPS